MSVLFSPYALRGMTMPNRIVVSPMCQYSAEDGAADGVAHDPSRRAGAVRRRACCAWRRPRSSRTAASRRAIWACGTTRTEAALAPVLAAIRKHAAIPAGDAGGACRPQGVEPGAVAGRPADRRGGWRLDHPGAVRRAAQAGRGAARGDGHGRAGPGAGRVRRDTRRARRGWGSTASRCMAAHGYLLHQFLSPVANQPRRTSTAGRWRTACASRSRCSRPAARPSRPDKPVGVRVSASGLGGGRLGRGVDHRAAPEALQRRGVRLDGRVVRGRGRGADDQRCGPGYQVRLRRRGAAARRAWRPWRWG